MHTADARQHRFLTCGREGTHDSPMKRYHESMDSQSGGVRPILTPNSGRVVYSM